MANLQEWFAHVGQKVPNRFNPANRSLEYRKRAEEARAKADETTDDTNKRSWLHTADTWERMASWEDITNPPKPIPGSK